MDNENRDMKVKASYGPNSTYKIMIPIFFITITVIHMTCVL